MIGCREWLVYTVLFRGTLEHRVRVNYSRYPPIRGHWPVAAPPYVVQPDYWTFDKLKRPHPMMG